MARLDGRLRHGLTLWRWRGPRVWALPIPRMTAVFTRTWIEHQRRLQLIEDACTSLNATTRSGGPFDSWDVEVRGGMFGRTRMLMAIEDQGSGTQYVRVQCRPVFSVVGVLAVAAFSALGLLAASDRAWTATLALGTLALLAGVRIIVDCGRSAAVAGLAVEQSGNNSA
jgi:hypothetical protein